nr:transposase [Clostridia bacterium]
MSYQRINKSIINIKNKNSNIYNSCNNCFTRKRKMEFTDYVWYLIMQKGKTTSMELDEYLKNKNGTYKISISKQAFSKQRQNLKPEIFIDIYKDYLIDFYSNYLEEVNTFKGYHVCAIDGSLFEIPNTETLREEYKTQKNSSGNRESARSKGIWLI